MEIIEDLQLRDGIVVLDEFNYINCKFTNCKVIYGGGDTSWTNTEFISCSIEWIGAAARGINILSAFGYAFRIPEHSTNDVNVMALEATDAPALTHCNSCKWVM